MRGKRQDGKSVGIAGFLPWSWKQERAPGGLVYDKGDPILAYMMGWNGP
jgi:hypothetical protein